MTAVLPGPLDRLITLPARHVLPPHLAHLELPNGLPRYTLGYQSMLWAKKNLLHPNGPRAGLPWEYVPSQQRFQLWYYALDEEGRWIFAHGVRRLAKGSGKSPHAAAESLTEFLGPVRFHGFDPRLPGGVIGRPVDMPLVQIAATSESQTANTMRMVRAMTAKGQPVVAKYQLDAGKTKMFCPLNSGELEVITSSAAAAEGALVTFAVRDETEHWRPVTGGVALAETLDRNLAKSGSRAIDTCNAWEPGEDSTAENVWDAWVMQEEGQTRSENLILYDARISPPELDLENDEWLKKAIAHVYDDCYWVDQRKIKASILDVRTPVDVAIRFYLNMPRSPEKAWTEHRLWALMANPDHHVPDGADIVLFFDGSRTNDATALMACEVSTGYVFTIGVWEPQPARGGHENIPINTNEVDAAVAYAFRMWNPVAFFADVREWESFTKSDWPKTYGSQLKIWAVPGGRDPQPIAWDMRTHVYDFTMAAELARQEIDDGAFRHDGDSRVTRHIVNMRTYPNRHGVSVSKETRQSSKKIDAGVCVIGVRMVRRLYLASQITREKDEVARTGRVHGFA